MKSVKTLCLCLALVFVGTCFAACGERRPQGEETFTYEQLMAKFDGEIEQNATIRVLDNQMAIETGHLEEVLDAFNEKYKEYNVNAVDANMDQYVDLEQNGPDGYGPDVLYQANDMLMRYAEGGHVLPLPTEKLDIEEIPDSVMEAYELETYGLDLYYGMPVAQQSTVLTYRKDLLPDNWETEWDDNKNSIPDMVENINDLYAYSAQVKSESNGSKYGLYMSLVDQYFNSGYLLSYLTMKSKAFLAVLPIQDILLLDSRARMNIPSTTSGNWQFKLKSLPNEQEMSDFCKMINSCERN